MSSKRARESDNLPTARTSSRRSTSSAGRKSDEAPAPTKPKFVRPTAEEKSELKAAKAETKKVRQAEKKVARQAEIAEGRQDRSLTYLSMKDIIPETSGIASVAVNGAENQIAVARENGSILLYDIVDFRKNDHFILRHHTGGKEGSSITRLAWTEGDRYILAGMFSGQIVQYDADGLFPVAIYPRSGGAIWDLIAIQRLAFAAVADGQLHCLHLREVDDHIEFLRAFPKVSGANRALTVAANVEKQLLCGSDDAGNIVGWALPALDNPMAGRAEQRFTCRLQDGVALALLVAESDAVVVAGTSTNEVVFIDSVHGHFLKSFSNHKGPVVCLTQAHGAIYASGWHELLRCYRVDTESKEWFPAEAKRRTHYHEASALAVCPTSGLFISAARDGTLMHTRLSRLFNSAAAYVDCRPNLVVSSGNLVASANGRRLQLFKFDVERARCIPFLTLELTGTFPIRNLFFHGDILSVVTDDRVKLFQVHSQSEDVEERDAPMSQVREYRLTCVSNVVVVPHPSDEEERAVIFSVGHNAFISNLFAGTAGGEFTFDAAIITMDLSSTTLASPDGDDLAVLSVGTGKGHHMIAINLASGQFHGQPSFEALGIVSEIKANPKGFALRTSRGWSQATFPKLRSGDAQEGTRIGSGLDIKRSAPLTAAGVPLNANYVHYNDTSEEAMLMFPRGLLSSNSNEFKIVEKGRFTEAVVVTSEDGEKTVPLVLERNLDGVVDQLPAMWRVRRFAN